jgi:hypothetical protein
MFELLFQDDVFGEGDAKEEGEEVLHWASMSILFIFQAELVLLLFALGLHFFKHVAYVLDFVIIPISIWLEITYHGLSLSPPKTSAHLSTVYNRCGWCIGIVAIMANCSFVTQCLHSSA